jgi:glucose-1-phosphate thymidylyltransferase
LTYDVIVMAAGEGRRLRPFTERWPKPILPIDGRPVIATLLHELREAGATRAWIVVGHLQDEIRTLLGDGSAFSLDLRYVEQPRADGSADAAIRAYAEGAQTPTVIVGADTVFTPGAIASFVSQARETHAYGALGVRRDPPPTPGHRGAVRIRDGAVVEVVDDEPGNAFGAAPLWWIGESGCQFLDYSLPGPPYGLAEAFQRAIGAGCEIRAIEIGKTRDLTYPVDLVKENFPYLGAS